MKILVIGSNGMLGHAMMDAWFDHEVLGLNLPNFDLTKALQVRHTIATLQPDVVINCAAYTNVDQCETEEALADLINGTGVGYLAKACDAQKVTLVHISTDYVFPGRNRLGYDEQAEPNPVSAYGRTKFHGEQQLWLNTKRAYLVRTAWLFGPLAPVTGAGLGKNFVQTMLTLGQSKPELKVVNDQYGKPTYTRDLAAFVKRLVIERAPHGTYHGVNEEPTTWYDFAKEIFYQAGITTPIIPCTTEEFPRPAKRPAWGVLLNTKRPSMRSWPEALSDYLLELGYTESA